MPRNPDPFRIYRVAGSFKSGKLADCIIATNAGPHRHAPIRIDCGLFLFELEPAPFALYVPRSSGAGDRGDAPTDCRVKAEAERADSEDKEAGQS